jgi:hypothetical protein
MSTTSSRNRYVRLLLVAAFGLGLSLVALPGIAPTRGQNPPAPQAAADGRKTEVQIIENITRATDRALDYLEKKQVREGPQDGSWHANQAYNAVAVLAFLSSGHVPGRGKYGDTVEDGVVKPGVLTRARNYLVSVANPTTGYISSGSMYEHGLATLALAEMYGMDPDPRVEAALRKAVELIVKTQSPAGGWRYSPAPVDQDMSVTVMQIVALRAANNAEIPVPAETLQKAVKYVRSCGAPTGGYGYAGPGAGPQTSAAGALSLQLLGQGDDPNIPRTLAYLQTIPVNWGTGGPQYFYYFHYYAIQAHYQYGGKEWNEWHPKVRELLLKHQNADGSWDVPPGTAEANLATGDNKVYPTALATLVLNIYKHYLPAYQR